jgi:hypothetical protein
VIHKGIRSMLFDLARAAGRADVTSTAAVDELVGHIDRVIAFLDEHAKVENQFVVSEIRALDPLLADELAAEHRGLDVVQREVQLAADALALTDLAQRPVAGAQLARIVNHLVAVQLIHMNREETEVNATLWAGRDDTYLMALRTRMAGSLPSDRFAAWRALVEPALNPVERRVL